MHLYPMPITNILCHKFSPKSYTKHELIDGKSFFEDDVVKYEPGFIKSPEDFFEILRDYLDWEVRSPARKEYWCNDFNRSYTYGKNYSERTFEARHFDSLIKHVRNKLYLAYGIHFEGCFLNYYETGRNALGWHQDDDPGIDHDKPIAVVSLGGERVLDYAEKVDGKVDKSTKKSILLGNGSLLLMKPGMQSTHYHQIPKAGFICKPRISMTFRGLI